MMNKLLTAIIALVFLFTAPAHAATQYVDTTCTNNGDGTAATCASSAGAAGSFNKFSSITCSGFTGSGNIIEIAAGKQNITSGSQWNIPLACSGSGGQNIIQNVSGGITRVTGITRYTPTWVNVAGTEWECTTCGWNSTSKFPLWVWYTRTNGTTCSTNSDCGSLDDARCDGSICEERALALQSQSTTSKAGAPPPQNYTCGNGTLAVNQFKVEQNLGKMCIRLSDDSNPNTNLNYFEVPTRTSAFALKNNDPTDITIRSNPGGGSLTIERLRDHGITFATPNTNLVIDNITVGFVMDRCLNAAGADLAANIKITNNHVHYCGQEGIRLQNDTGANSEISSNTVHNIQYTGDSELTSTPLQGFADVATGYRMAEMTTLLLKDNTCYKVGGGKTNRGICYNFENGSAGITAQANYAYQMFHGPATDENRTSAFRWSSLSAGDDHTTSIIENNRIHDVDQAFNWDAKSGLAVTLGIDIRNNTISEVEEYGIRVDQGTYTGSVTLDNNVFSNVTAVPAELVSMPSTNTAAFAQPTYNVWHCPSCASTIVNWKGATYTSATIGTFDANSSSADPDILDVGTGPTLNLTAAAGSAYNAASATFAPSVDYLGTARPKAVTDDIGAHEFDSGVTTTTTTVTTTTTTVTTTTTTVVSTSSSFSIGIE